MRSVHKGLRKIGKAEDEVLEKKKASELLIRVRNPIWVEARRIRVFQLKSCFQDWFNSFPAHVFSTSNPPQPDVLKLCKNRRFYRKN
jgi:hypothetical protein